MNWGNAFNIMNNDNNQAKRKGQFKVGFDPEVAKQRTQSLRTKGREEKRLKTIEDHRHSLSGSSPSPSPFHIPRERLAEIERATRDFVSSVSTTLMDPSDCNDENIDAKIQNSSRFFDVLDSLESAIFLHFSANSIGHELDQILLIFQNSRLQELLFQSLQQLSSFTSSSSSPTLSPSPFSFSPHSNLIQLEYLHIGISCKSLALVCASNSIMAKTNHNGSMQLLQLSLNRWLHFLSSYLPICSALHLRQPDYMMWMERLLDIKPVEVLSLLLQNVNSDRLFRSIPQLLHLHSASPLLPRWMQLVHNIISRLQASGQIDLRNYCFLNDFTSLVPLLAIKTASVFHASLSSSISSVPPVCSLTLPDVVRSTELSITILSQLSPFLTTQSPKLTESVVNYFQLFSIIHQLRNLFPLEEALLTSLRSLLHLLEQHLSANRFVIQDLIEKHNFVSHMHFFILQIMNSISPFLSANSSASSSSSSVLLPDSSMEISGVEHENVLTDQVLSFLVQIINLSPCAFVDHVHRHSGVLSFTYEKFQKPIIPPRHPSPSQHSFSMSDEFSGSDEPMSRSNSADASMMMATTSTSLSSSCSTESSREYAVFASLCCTLAANSFSSTQQWIIDQTSFFPHLIQHFHLISPSYLPFIISALCRMLRTNCTKVQTHICSLFNMHTRAISIIDTFSSYSPSSSSPSEEKLVSDALYLVACISHFRSLEHSPPSSTPSSSSSSSSLPNTPIVTTTLINFRPCK